MPTKRYLEEGDPIEQKYTPAQPAFTSTGMGIDLECDIFNGLKMRVSMMIDDTCDEAYANERTDQMRRMVERQRAVFEHRQARMEIASRAVTLRELPDMQKKWSDERDRLKKIQLAGFQLAWNRKQARGEFRLSDTQRVFLENFDAETQKKLDEFQHMLDTFPEQIKNFEDRVKRCRRILDGFEEKTNLIDDLWPEMGMEDEAIPPHLRDAAE